jgi:hypothetical protein
MIKNIIYSSPTLIGSMKVYRGLKTKIFPNMGDVYTNDVFVSISLSIKKLWTFANITPGRNGTIMNPSWKLP